MTISEFDKCSNCGACYNICKQQAISVDEDKTFYAPLVNNKLCVECGECVKVCPVNNDYEHFEPIYACAGWHKEDNILLTSSSGGIFYGIAKSITDAGGIVFSAVYSNDFKEVNFASTDETSITSLQKSKYVESQINDTFVRIKEELDRGRQVLFCAAPCQIAGLKCFLKKEYNNLLTCDFACGGLPSHRIYREYLSELEKKYKSDVCSVDFRPKTHGWKRYALLIGFDNGRKYNRLGTEDPYLKSFLYGKYTVRDYCLECKFSDHHFSDITIADFWRHHELSDLVNPKGISLILCNTVKGKSTIISIEKDYIFKELSVEDVGYNNKKTVVNEKELERHRLFIKTFEEKGLDFCYKKFLPNSNKDKIKNLFKRFFLKSYERNR